MRAFVFFKRIDDGVEYPDQAARFRFVSSPRKMVLFFLKQVCACFASPGASSVGMECIARSFTACVCVLSGEGHLVCVGFCTICLVIGGTVSVVQYTRTVCFFFLLFFFDFFRK